MTNPSIRFPRIPVGRDKGFPGATGMGFVRTTDSFPET